MQTYSFTCPSCKKQARIQEIVCGECGAIINMDLDCIILHNFSQTNKVYVIFEGKWEPQLIEICKTKEKAKQLVKEWTENDQSKKITSHYDIEEYTVTA